MSAKRYHATAGVHTVRAQAGVGDQDTTCENGSEGCPGTGAPTGTIPCWQCLQDGGDDDAE